MEPLTLAAMIMKFIQQNPLGTLYMGTALFCAFVYGWSNKKHGTAMNNYVGALENNYRQVKTSNTELKVIVEDLIGDVKKFKGMVEEIHSDFSGFRQLVQKIASGVDQITAEAKKIDQTGIRVSQVGMKLMDLKKDIDTVEKNHQILLSSFEKKFKKD